MKKFVFIFALTFILPIDQASAADESGRYLQYGSPTCDEYLDAYARSSQDTDGSWNGNHAAWNAFGWIRGFISGYNLTVQNGKKDAFPDLESSDFYSWAASWCRDNPRNSVSEAMVALINKHQ